MTSATIYQEIAQRTGGDIYLGVVGPVRTGKSTLIKRFLEQLVLPNIDDPYRRQRAQDELPQSGSGKTIMTAEPKFIPEEAVTVSPRRHGAAFRPHDRQRGLSHPQRRRGDGGRPDPHGHDPLGGPRDPPDGGRRARDKEGHRRALHRRDRRHDRRQRHGVQPSRLSGGRAPRHHGPAGHGKPFVVIINSAAPEGSEARPCARA